MFEHNDIQRPRRDRRGKDLGLVGAIAVWCECLQGKGILRNGLELIASGIGADAVVLTRVSRATGRQGRSMFHDRGAGVLGVRRLERSYASCVLGRYFATPKAGSVWSSAAVDDDLDPVLTEFQRRRNLAELIVIPLSVDDKTIDFFEMHFAATQTGPQLESLGVLAATLTRAWAHRATGLFSEHVLQKARTGPAGLGNESILSFSNPARLSRAEYRVCMLCGRGLSPKAVRQELTISASTLRTHLRNIYAKTGTSCQAELVYRLLSNILPIETGQNARFN
jgi:DNA-binding CsgD family transcriptional regulator